MIKKCFKDHPLATIALAILLGYSLFIAGKGLLFLFILVIAIV